MANTTPHLPAPIDAVSRVLEATEIERLQYRRLFLLTLDELHAAQCELDAERAKVAELRDCQRRLAVSLFGEPQ